MNRSKMSFQASRFIGPLNTLNDAKGIQGTVEKTSFILVSHSVSCVCLACLAGDYTALFRRR